ncbi:hypothetical protein IU433_26445 [Nocardia puris]|uniref:hypothetical protein n=1 Tax=Nocardia TaxID=1817 RepID=UPI001895A349|nr:MULTISPECIES: hypothetical protein [Nocardia]MBF6185085.1 hypothetical protein [Nocardia farcinica]MBF6360780.1 hypothetical protein [Nocardia farcinica]MBF6462555.1 hypothetical protein [Nocardia puris]
MPTWLAIVQSTATTIGVLIALVVAVFQVLKAQQGKAIQDEQMAEDRQRYEAQMAALQRAEDDRIAAQARGVVPMLFRAAIFCPDMWSVKVASHSNSPITELSVSVEAVDAGEQKVPDGCESASGRISTKELFSQFINEALTGAMSATLNRAGYGMFGSGASLAAGRAAQQVTPDVTEVMKEVTGQLAL